MKINYIISLLAATVLTVGCTPSNKSETNTVSKQMDTTQEAAEKAARNLQSYTYEKKSEFVAYMNSQHADLEANIQELSSKIDASSDKVKAEAKPKLAALKEQAAALKKQIAATTDATPTTWSGIKADSNNAYQALKDGVVQSREWLADKIAP